MHRERGRGRESARACVRAAFGALGICARKGGGDEREFIGPLLSADGCARAHTHMLSLSLRTHAQMTRAAAAAAMHKDTGLAPRLTDVALALNAPALTPCECESSLRVLPRIVYTIGS